MSRSSWRVGLCAGVFSGVLGVGVLWPQGSPWALEDPPDTPAEAPPPVLGVPIVPGVEPWRWPPEQDTGTGDDDILCDLGARPTPPQLISSVEVVYPPEALRARAAGTAIVQCDFTETGTVENCRILKSVPLMDEAVMNAMKQRRYRPATLRGKPIRIRYIVSFKLQPPP